MPYIAAQAHRHRLRRLLLALARPDCVDATREAWAAAAAGGVAPGDGSDLLRAPTPLLEVVARTAAAGDGAPVDPGAREALAQGVREADGALRAALRRRAARDAVAHGEGGATGEGGWGRGAGA